MEEEEEEEVMTDMADMETEGQQVCISEELCTCM